MDDRQGRHHPGAARVGDHRRDGQDALAALHGADRAVRRARVPARRRRGQQGAEGPPVEARRGRHHGRDPGGRPDHREAVEGPGQRRGGRRREGGHRPGVVRRAPRPAPRTSTRSTPRASSGRSTWSRCSARPRRSWTRRSGRSPSPLVPREASSDPSDGASSTSRNHPADVHRNAVGGNNWVASVVFLQRAQPSITGTVAHAPARETRST